MIRSHYVPQFILRNFCLDGKLTYCDLDEKSVQKRTPYSVFSEKGYYPEKLEKSLSINAEYANRLRVSRVSDYHSFNSAYSL